MPISEPVYKKEKEKQQYCSGAQTVTGKSVLISILLVSLHFSPIHMGEDA